MTPQIEKIKNEMAALVQDVIDFAEDPATARKFLNEMAEKYPELAEYAKKCLAEIEGA
jgi:uncharacterized protein Yka (UPF0111/DUF47 family)